MAYCTKTVLVQLYKIRWLLPCMATLALTSLQHIWLQCTLLQKPTRLQQYGPKAWESKMPWQPMQSWAWLLCRLSGIGLMVATDTWSVQGVCCVICSQWLIVLQILSNSSSHYGTSHASTRNLLISAVHVWARSIQVVAFARVAVDSNKIINVCSTNRSYICRSARCCITSTHV